MTHADAQTISPTGFARWRRAASNALVLALLLSLAATLDSRAEEDEDSEALNYTVEIKGIKDDAVLETLEKTSVLENLKDRAPESDVMLLRRIEDDQKRFEDAMRSDGYYEAVVSNTLNRDVSPYEITFTIEPGRLFKLEAYDIVYVGDHTKDVEPPQPDLERLNLQIGMPAKSDAIVAAQVQLLRYLADRAYPLAEVIDRKAVVDFAEGDMTVTLEVNPGPEAKFGPLSISGLERTSQEYLDRVLEWKTDQPYDQRQLDDVRRKLVEMGLFDSVRIDVPDDLNDKDELPVDVTVIEGKARTIGTGVSYSTDEGFGGEVFWRHRNFFGEQESLKVTGTLSEIRQGVSVDFEKPNALRVDETLLINGTLQAEQNEAFTEKSASGFVGFRRQLGEHWEITYGVQPEYSDIDDNDGDEIWTGVGVPVTLKRDTTDNLLDPSKGYRFLIETTPAAGHLSDFTKFVRTEFKPSVYWAPFPTDRVIFAARGRIGSILGESTDDVPANHRLYAGGGGSIRGYEFQTVGPLDSDNDPVGGRSVLEVGGELRLRATETIGVVPFVEGGTAYEDRVPEPDREIRWAAGLGLRYFTGIGPLRLDLAFPLNRRSIDDSFQFYVSIGQAF